MDINGELWPGWSVVQLIGRGSYGVVYHIQRQIGGTVEDAALKIISLPQNDSEIENLRMNGYDDYSIAAYYSECRARVESEYAQMAALKGNSNIVYCDDYRSVPRSDGLGWDIYIKMELLTPLKAYLSGSVDEKTIIALGCDLCSALTACRELNIVHRDIKPENIFVSRDGHFKLGDFGIARTMEGTSTGTSTGTYSYMAPEVYSHQKYNHSVDIYSLGIVMYQLLNEGRIPFVLSSVPTPGLREAALQRRFSGEALPPPLNGCEKLKKIVLKACAFRPEKRYRSAGEMLAELESLNSSSKPRKANIKPGIIAASLAVLIAGGSILGISLHKGKAPYVPPSSNTEKLASVTTGDNPQPEEPEHPDFIPSNEGNFIDVDRLQRPDISFPPTEESPLPEEEPLYMVLSTESCSGLQQKYFSSSTASSVLYAENMYFIPEYAYDNDQLTSWQEGAEGMGIGESLTLCFPAETKLDYIQMYPGFTGNEYVYVNNGRPKTLLFSFSDGSSCYFDFEDRLGPVLMELSRSVYTEYIEITIIDAYDAQWQDMAITEVSAFTR